MAKFCPNCGAEQPDESLFCGECGTAMPDAPAVSQEPTVPFEPVTDVPDMPDTPDAPQDDASASAENPYQAPSYGAEQPSYDAPSGYGAPEQPYAAPEQPAYGAQPAYGEGGGYAPTAPRAPRKPLGKTTKIILIAAAAVIVLALAAYFILNAVFTPGKTIDGFVKALDDASVAGVQKYAASSDADAPLDDTAAQALIDLYVGDTAFRETLKAELDAQTSKKNKGAENSSLFQLKTKKHVFFSTYAIEISPCMVEISVDHAGTTVTIGGQTVTAGRRETDLPASLEEYETAYLDDDYASDPGRLAAVLPGRYAATATYENVLGQSFTKTFDLDVTSLRTYANAPGFEAKSMWVSNNSDLAIDLTAGGEVVCTMGPQSELYFGALENGTTFSAACAGGELASEEGEYEQTATWGDVEVSATVGTDEYFNISFPSIYVNNEYDFDLTVAVNGTEVGTIFADGGWEMAPMAEGMELTFTPVDMELDPYTLTIDADTYSVNPSFDVLSTYIDNYYHADLTASVNGEERGTVPSYGSLSVTVVAGDEISVTLDGAPFAAPYVYTVADEDDDYLNPKFELTDEANEQLMDFAETYVNSAFAAYNELNVDALAAMEQSGLTEELLEMAEDEQADQAELGYREDVFTLTATDIRLDDAEIEANSSEDIYVEADLVLYYTIDYKTYDADGNETYSDASTDNDYYLYLDLVYTDDGWHIAD